jgi:hypothetical protein
MPFLSGLVPDAAGTDLYGRPVGAAIDPCGALLVSVDTQKLIALAMSSGLAATRLSTCEPR